MVFQYLHHERISKDTIYNQQLTKWLISNKYISGERKTKILDLGSGRGHFYFALKKLGYKAVFAADKFPQFKECRKGDILKGIPFKDSSFDLIISRDLAEHIADHEKFFQEHYRLLKKGGRIIVMTPNAKHLTLGEFYSDYTHIMPYTPSSLKEALEMHGFKEVIVTKLRAIPRLWVFTIRAFDFLFSRKKNNLLGIAVKK